MGPPRSPPLPAKGAHDHSNSVTGPSQARPHPLRTSLTEPQPISNIFSDEFSLEPLDGQQSSGSPVSSIRTSISSRSTLDNDRQPYISPFGDSSEVLPREEMPEMSQRHVPPDTASVARASSSASSAIGSAPSVAQRSISTSSRFSMPRAMSPYRGQTGPSHPYAMYPQGIAVNRSPSISSASTVRPSERTPVTAPPPQHPYAMYSQNTVPEEAVDESQPQNPTIPLGFPVRDPVYQNGPRQAPNEHGDIIGPDGHLEQLPPYSRYPDVLPAKSESDQNLAVNTGDLGIRDETPISPESAVSSRTLMSVQGHGSVSAARASGDQGEAAAIDDGSGGFKERLAKKGQKRVCCGLPIWMFLVCGAVLLLGAVMGGVIGGLLGSEQGAKDAEAALESAASSTEGPKATVTVTASTVLDATPLATDPGPLPTTPTGEFTLPGSSISDQSNSCLNNSNYLDAWQCEPAGMWSYSVDTSNGAHSISVEPGELVSNFHYGAQFPFFDTTKNFTLKLMQDKTKMELGPALFFFTPFDKLVVIPEEDFPWISPRRSVSGREIARRASGSNRRIAEPADKPWFCWWNSTFLEAFLYINETSSSALSSTQGEAKESSSLTAYLPYPSGSGDVNESQPVGRQAMPVKDSTSSSSAYYPCPIKFEEKRFAQNGSPPYCEQILILDDGNIGEPIGEQVIIDEVDTATAPAVTGPFPQSMYSKRDSEDIGCFCQWFVP